MFVGNSSSVTIHLLVSGSIVLSSSNFSFASFPVSLQFCALVSVDRIQTSGLLSWLIHSYEIQGELECASMPNVMAAVPNIGGAFCSTPQSLADAHN